MPEPSRSMTPSSSTDSVVERQELSLPVEQQIKPTPARFLRWEKWFIVVLTAFVGLFSPLTANIYFPAIPTIARAFNKSVELINLTVTMYMVLQGVSPMFWGPMSDHIGRRPTTAACLALLAASCIGLALVPTDAYWLLMVLRCFQAAGSASTIAIGAGVIGDISSREERGGFFGLFTLGPMVGPAVGPVIGGALSGSLGWRSIFWFICIASSICLVLVILVQPETLTLLYENGKDATPVLYQPVIPIISRRTVPVQGTSVPRKVPRNPFVLFKNLQVVNTLVIAALINGVMYAIIAPISSIFEEVYPFLNQTKIGLCFLAVGCGMLIGSVVTGRILDWEYQKFKQAAFKEFGEGADLSKIPSFPLEKARLRLLPLHSAVMTVACVGYGWSLHHKVNIAVPLILQFIIGFNSMAVLNSASTLMIDLVPTQSSSVTACNNIVRCTFSAVLVSVIEPVINAIGVGWTFVIVAGLSFISIPCMFFVMWRGPLLRQRAAMQFPTTKETNPI